MKKNQKYKGAPVKQPIAKKAALSHAPEAARLQIRSQINLISIYQGQKNVEYTAFLIVKVLNHPT